MYELNFRNNNNDADPVKIYVDHEFLCNENDTVYLCDLEAKRPYYRLRGKPVTPEEAIGIIAKTDNLFSFAYGLKGSIGGIFLEMSYFEIAHAYNGHHGWVHPNGVIGQNSHSGIKYPSIDEILEELVPITAEFPYLDMIVAISKWNEVPPKWWDMFGENDDYKYYDDEDFTESIEMGIWIHDRTIDIVDPKRAAELYEEYDRLYDGIDKKIFFPDYYRDFAPERIGRNFLRKCLNVYGIDDVDGFIEKGKREGKAFCPLPNCESKETFLYYDGQ